MFAFVVVLQVVGIAIIMCELVWLLSRAPSRYQLILLIMLTSMLINFVGQLIEITATTEIQATLGIRFSYVGKPFIMLSMFLFLVNFCRVRVPKLIMYAACLETALASICAFTFPYHQLFCTTQQFVHEGLFPHMVMGKGPAYLFHSAIIVVFFVFNIRCCIKQMRKSKTAQERVQVQALFAMSTVCICGFLLFLSGVAGGYDTTLPCYVISLLLLSHVLLKHNLIDSLTLAREQSVRDYRDGLMVLNQRGDLIYANESAGRVLLCMVEPNAQRPKADPQAPAVLLRKLNGSKGLLEPEHLLEDEIRDQGYSKSELKAVVESLCTYARQKEKLFLADRVYDVRENVVENDGIDYGHTYEITDVTSSYNYAARLQHDVEAKTKQIRHIQRSIIASFSNIVEARDDITGHHIKNTSRYVKAIADELAKRVEADPQSFPDEFGRLLEEGYVETLEDAAPLHDVGKVSVPDSVLTKPGRLTDAEFEIIKGHSQKGADLIEETMRGIEADGYVEIAKNIAQSHHERWDGEGYPQGLRQNQIPLCARIMAVADVYDALRAERQYKPAFSKEKSRAIIKGGAGTQFDPLVVDAFLAVVDQVEERTV